jgi:CDP-glucose 4,6-dehydratase
MWFEKTGTKPEWVDKHDGGPHEAGYLKLDCTRLKETFGWSPKWNISGAMERLVAWYSTYLAGGDVETCMKEQVGEFL